MRCTAVAVSAPAKVFAQADMAPEDAGRGITELGSAALLCGICERCGRRQFWACTPAIAPVLHSPLLTAVMLSAHLPESAAAFGSIQPQRNGPQGRDLPA